MAPHISVAQESDLPKQTLIIKVNVFDGKSKALAENQRVLVEGNLIKTIGGETLKANKGASVIDGGGRTLMPGLVEGHAHLMLMGPSLPAMEANTTWEDFAIHGTKMAEMYLIVLNQNQIRNVEPGQTAEAVFRAFPGRTFTGTVKGLFLSSRDAEYVLDGATPEVPEILDTN